LNDEAIVFQKNILDLVGVGLAPTPVGRPQGYAPACAQKHYLNIYRTYLVPFQSGFDKQILGKKAESIYQNQIA
jgi:hypothetical protein